MKLTPQESTSGFGEYEYTEIRHRVTRVKRALKEVRERRRKEQKNTNHIKAGHVLKAGLKFRIKKQHNADKQTEQIQRGRDLAKRLSK